ncbi:MAG: hypothetical protein M1834_004513 [Cirrosporium novae-zelandiae]|nr:MAG: hypothetical protein M1834_004513 [Cirrosporium novae-zelandiae]
MGKRKRKNLSEAEIWDDSALIESWDAAYEEYKLYHSIAARGENVEDVLKKAELEDLTGDGNANVEGTGAQAAIPEENGGSEDGEIENEENIVDAPQVTRPEGSLVAKDTISNIPNGVDANPSVAGNLNGQPTVTVPMPQLPVGMQDEGLKNLMMSWYYAGYYTGLYEGRQQGLQEISQSLDMNKAKTG